VSEEVYDPAGELEEGLPRPSWRVRRRWVALIEAYCALGVGYLIVAGQDTRLHETIASGLLALAGTTMASFIFGAVWDDKGLCGALGARGVRPAPRRRGGGFQDYGDDLQPPEGYAR
jgi:hypothetical protein